MGIELLWYNNTMLHSFFAVAESLVKAKSLLAIFAAFASGFLLSFTPCFLPLVPVVLGMLGFSSSPGRGRVAYLIFFAFGLSTVYTALGLISGVLGIMFGRISEHYLTQIIAGNVFLLMGLALLGVFNLPFIRLEAKYRPSLAGSFLLGGG